MYDAATEMQNTAEGIQKSSVAKGVDCDWHENIVFGESVRKVIVLYLFNILSSRPRTYG